MNSMVKFETKFSIYMMEKNITLKVLYTFFLSRERSQTTTSGL